jgi:hypothetical protein
MDGRLSTEVSATAASFHSLLLLEIRSKCCDAFGDAGAQRLDKVLHADAQLDRLGTSTEPQKRRLQSSHIAGYDHLCIKSKAALVMATPTAPPRYTVRTGMKVFMPKVDTPLCPKPVSFSDT